MSNEMIWLPQLVTWKDEMAALKRGEGDCWIGLQRLATSQIDLLQTAKLDREAQRLHAAGMIPLVRVVRVALLGSSTLKHLVAGVRVAGIRRGLWFEVYEGDYGQYLQELLEPSALDTFRPEIVILALDAQHLRALMLDGVSATLDRLELCWRQAKERFGASVIQQAGLPIFEDAFGNQEHRLGDSPQNLLSELNGQLRDAADREGVALLAVDKYVSMGGIDAWHDPALWHLAKQEVHPAMAPLYGDLLGRVIAALQGRSAKCLVLDLDNTLWGGVVGDDGIDGLVLGQGDAAGEAYLEFQQYCLSLKRRGVVLAVCSKNDEVNARGPFEQRSEMLLKLGDFACFMANWEDKATNLRRIAARLNLGLDALVFVDDNPAERELVRRELPEVRVPELPVDPAGYVRCVARAGYFEGVVLTKEDRHRTEQYANNAQREGLRDSATNMRAYLQSLQMELAWRPFDEVGLARIVQLTNKTNQFNLTTIRVSEAEVRGMLADPCVLSWQVSLRDRFGDNGTIALASGRLDATGNCAIELWLMSCRVLGRGVEEACLNLIAEATVSRGGRRLVGEYRPTAKNGMVKDLFSRLGFTELDKASDGVTRWALDLESFVERKTEIQVKHAE